jgi:SAM-dependent methyltransferase
MPQAADDISIVNERGKELIKKALQRLGLLHHFYRIRERKLAVRSSGNENQTPADGLPVPPAVLRLRVAGTGDFDWFLEGGARAAAAIRAALSRHGTALERLDGILDFGCGCGRVVRRWNDVSGVHGCDLNAEAIAWCRANLPFARFDTNELKPPLRYADESFDFVCALSVFTHLTEVQQRAWVGELQRVLRPNGLLLITTHGSGFVDQLSASERERYDGGNLVVRWESMAGSNMCSAFHPESYLRNLFSSGFELLEFEPEGALGNPPQDQILLRKSAS